MCEFFRELSILSLSWCGGEPADFAHLPAFLFPAPCRSGKHDSDTFDWRRTAGRPGYDLRVLARRGEAIGYLRFADSAKLAAQHPGWFRSRMPGASAACCWLHGWLSMISDGKLRFDKHFLRVCHAQSGVNAAGGFFHFNHLR